MKSCLLFFCAVGLALNGLSAQEKTVAERLGYPADSKLLIIHADDLAVSHSENDASIKGMVKGSISSSSIMVPCPWFEEIAEYGRNNPNADFGLHLTLTSEWKHYKWGPVTSRDSVTSLVDAQGNFYSDVPEFAANADAYEVELEIRNQIKKALRSGIDVTHLDTHMGALAAKPEFIFAYLKVAQEFGLPQLLTKQIKMIENENLKSLLGGNSVFLDQLYMATPKDFENGMAAYYSNVLKKMEPGLNCLLIHAAYDDAEMHAITVDHPDYGAAWRQADFDFFTSPECKKLIDENNIVLVTWREIRDKITRTN